MIQIFVRASTAAAALFCCAAAAAAGGPLDLSTGSTGFTSTPTAGGFSDIYTFTLSTASFLSGSITTAGIPEQVVSFTSVSFTGTTGFPLTFTPVLPYGFETWIFGGFVSAGDYTLDVVGTNGAGLGSYAGVVAVSATTPPVPEPQTLALLVGGLAMIGSVARRHLAR